MRALTSEELGLVAGGVDQNTAIVGNMAIAGMGVTMESALFVTGATLSATGIGIVAGLTLISLGLTASFLYDQFC